MTEAREFHIGDILSVTTDKLVSPRHIDGVYDILSFMAGEPVWTHQLPRVCDEAKPVLLDKHPQLANVDTNGVNQNTWENWLDKQVARFGETLAVTPMSKDEHVRIDPLSELAEKVHPSKIIPIVVDDK